MPNYGGANIHAARSYFRASRDMDNVMKYHPGGSLLASNFNDIWCGCLNAVMNGAEIKYFAMLHSDVAPEDFWVDDLIEEMEAHDLDVLGVAVAIKDTRGMTSLALGHDNDDWNPLCRLSMFDCHCLPPTFTSDDLGRPLLLNTGCWAIRWNQELFSKLADSGDVLCPCAGPHFEINDRIVFNRSVGRYQAQTEPEDWNFSRQCHRLGLRIGATRKIRCHHYGEMAFQNYVPWGQHKWDIESKLKASPVPKVDRHGFCYPRDVQGWLTYDEGKHLWWLAQGKRVLEIGSYLGLSTICLAQTADHVTSVDPHDGTGTAVPQNTFDKFRSNLERYDLWRKVLPVVGTLSDELELLRIQDSYDLVFIDGSHDYESVAADIEAACELLTPDGLIVFHDYASDRDPGVTKAVDEFVSRGAEIADVYNSLAVVRPPAAIPLEV